MASKAYKGYLDCFIDDDEGFIQSSQMPTQPQPLQEEDDELNSSHNILANLDPNILNNRRSSSITSNIISQKCKNKNKISSSYIETQQIPSTESSPENKIDSSQDLLSNMDPNILNSRRSSIASNILSQKCKKNQIASSYIETQQIPSTESSPENKINSSQDLLSNMDPSFLNNRSSNFASQKSKVNKRQMGTYRETQQIQFSSSENSSSSNDSILSTYTMPKASYLNTQVCSPAVDTTQMKRSKHFDLIMDSTYPEPIKQVTQFKYLIVDLS